MKKLFGGFSGNLSLFTNNPYQIGNSVDVAGTSALLPNEKGDCKEPLKKAKKLTGKEESKKAPTEPIGHPAEEKKKKKKNEINNLPLDLKSKSQDVAEKLIAVTYGASVDIEEGMQSVKKNKKKKVSVVDDIGVSNVVLTHFWTRCVKLFLVRSSNFGHGSCNWVTKGCLAIRFEIGTTVE